MKPIASKTIPICAVALSLFCCTWVSVTDEGRNVRVLDAESAARCERIGNVGAKTADRVTIFARSDRKVQAELESLARNEATELGGDAIVPIGFPVDGRQSFEVYRCLPR
ncbi:MAG TPA: DUF4156 domain-containing protein [Myxococcota bacterium]